LHAKYLIVLALAIAGGISYGCHAAWSVALGGGIQLLNLTVLERSVRAVLSTGSAAGNAASLAQVTLVLRTVLFFTAVIYVLAFTSVQPLSFLAGLLVIVPAALWHGLTPPAPQESR
jgi:ATP synthase I chain